MLYRLCSVDGVSGDERGASEIALSMLESYTDDCSIDDFGNVIGHIKSTGNKPKLLLDAHIDRVGLIVSFIDDNGFIKVGAVGGPDRRVLAAQSVTIHGKEKVKGVVSVLPPHVKSGDGVPKIEEIVIDTGYTKQEPSTVNLWLCSAQDTVQVRLTTGAEWHLYWLLSKCLKVRNLRLTLTYRLQRRKKREKAVRK